MPSRPATTDNAVAHPGVPAPATPVPSKAAPGPVPPGAERPDERPTSQAAPADDARDDHTLIKGGTPVGSPSAAPGEVTKGSTPIDAVSGGAEESGTKAETFDGHSPLTGSAASVGKPGTGPASAEPNVVAPTEVAPAARSGSGPTPTSGDAAAADNDTPEPGVPAPLQPAATGSSDTAAGPVPSGADHPGERPAGLAGARDDAPDDLRLIKGIGPKNERSCNGLGVFHFGQIADWSPANAEWVGHHMAFPGRIEREHWVAQAKLLAAGIDTAHAAAVRSGAVTIDETADVPISETEGAALHADLPQFAPAVAGEANHLGARPLGLVAAPGDLVDDLKRIKGIGPQNETRLHGLGIWRFGQIAAWTPDNVKWVGSYLAFPGRINREHWVAQAADLAAGRVPSAPPRAASSAVPPP